MSKKVKEVLGKEFVCTKCGQAGADVESLTMSGTGLTRLLDIQPYRYAFASCENCGYTEVYNLKTLEGKDNLGTFLDVLFS